MKDAKQFLQEANAVVPRISSADGIAKHDAGNSLFILECGQSILPQLGYNRQIFLLHCESKLSLGKHQ